MQANAGPFLNAALARRGAELDRFCFAAVVGDERLAARDLEERIHDLRVELRSCHAPSSAIASVNVSPFRYGRLLIIASNASATAMMRASRGMSLPASLSGTPLPSYALVVRAHDVERHGIFAEQRLRGFASRAPGAS